MGELTLLSAAGLAGLGALHGINPGMGWLFAVALGLQEKRGRAVWRALPALAAGHALAIAVVVAVAALAGTMVPLGVLKPVVAGTLVAFGGWKLLRHSHPRYGGMRVRQRDLVIWSFLMASAHGAGLMVLPLVMGQEEGGRGVAVAGAAHGGGGHSAHLHPALGHQEAGHGASRPDTTARPPSSPGPSLRATLSAGVAAGQAAGLLVALIHTAGYLAVTGLVSVVVYHKLGLRLLRTAWINLDLIWAAALVATGVAAVLV